MAREKIVYWAVIGLFLLLALSLLNIAGLQAVKYRELSNKNCIRLLPQLGCRGKIFDRQGKVIVDNELSYDVMLLPQMNNLLEKSLIDVSHILGASAGDLKEAFKNSFISLSIPVTVAKNIDVKKAMALEQLKMDLPSIIIQPRPQRSYPYGRLASHIIGYVNEIDRWRLTRLADYGYKTKDIVGFGGVEEKYDYYLRQEEGGLSVEVDHKGKFVRILGFKPPRQGKDMELTLDLKIQKIAEESLKGKKGSVIVMDPYSGAIISMASYPDFNPSVFVDKTGSSIPYLFNNPEAPLINRAISATYPPGSAFKVIVATAALETKKINLHTAFLCSGGTLVGRQEFACWNTHGSHSIIGAIAHSCNVFFYKTGLLLGAQAIHDYALKFGLSHPIPFELPYEASGFVPSPLWRKINRFKNWYDGDTANLSIGQGELLVTPLQMTRVMAVFANQGYLVTPYIVKSIDGRDLSLYQKKPLKFPLRKDTLNYIREGLREAVSDPKGTGNVLSSLTVSVAGKTGTAQAPPGQPHAWFIGFFPFKEPKYVIGVLLEHGGPGYYSCLIAKRIIEEMIKEGLIKGSD